MRRLMRLDNYPTLDNCRQMRFCLLKALFDTVENELSEVEVLMVLAMLIGDVELRDA